MYNTSTRTETIEDRRRTVGGKGGRLDDRCNVTRFGFRLVLCRSGVHSNDVSRGSENPTSTDSGHRVRLVRGRSAVHTVKGVYVSRGRDRTREGPPCDPRGPRGDSDPEPLLTGWKEQGVTLLRLHTKCTLESSGSP